VTLREVSATVTCSAKDLRIVYMGQALRDRHTIIFLKNLRIVYMGQTLRDRHVFNYYLLSNLLYLFYLFIYVFSPSIYLLIYLSIYLSIYRSTMADWNIAGCGRQRASVFCTFCTLNMPSPSCTMSGIFFSTYFFIYWY
jgi:hypothetical protein